MKEKLAREHAAMLKDAISRPGVRETMEILSELEEDGRLTRKLPSSE